MAINLNKEYFDKIDTPNKAYWIGFIWSDGSVMHRKRRVNTEEYLLKIDLMLQDYEHLKKFNNDIDGGYEIKIYNSVSSFVDTSKICRISIYNKYLVKNLIDKYGIFSYRTDSTKLLEEIPKEYKRDFIRGILDADGSFHKYVITDRGKIVTKYTLRFGATPEILRYVESYLIENNIINEFKRKLTKRHEERDGCYFQLTLSGKPNVMNALSLLYDNSETYLDRKYEKYIIMKEGGSNINQE